MGFKTASLAMRKEYLLLIVLWLQIMSFMFAMEGVQSNNSYQESQISLVAPINNETSQAKDQGEENLGSAGPEKNAASAAPSLDTSRTSSPELLGDQEEFVESVTDNHNPSDLGTYSDWAEMQTVDGTFNTLTEEDTGPSASGGGVLGTDTAGATASLLIKNAKRGSKFTLNAGVDAQNISVYGKQSTGAKAPYTVKGMIYNDSNGAPDALLGTSNEGTVPASASWITVDFASAIQLAPGDYWLVVITATKLDMYYDEGSANQAAYLADDYGDGPSDPFDDNPANDPTYTNSNYSIYIEYDYLPTNYEVDREFSWSTATTGEDYAHLCIKLGTIGAENLEIDVWDSSWTTISAISNAYANSWFNISVYAYLTSGTIEFRFHGVLEEFDSIFQDSWQIDAILLHTWTGTPTNTDIVDWSVANTTTVNLQFQDTYQWWIIWNDTDSEAWIEDTTPPYTLETEHVNLVKPPADGNHTFQFNATDIGSFPVTITLDRVGYVSQQFMLTFNVGERSTIISTSSILSGSTQPVPYGGNFSFHFIWKDVGEDVPIPGGAVNINETAVALLSSVNGNYSFQFAAQALGTYGMNITITKAGYSPISFLLTFPVIRSSTLIAS
ncbi:MAG: hypothetical protein ACFFGZ_19215, partial [Candidatus Thorarchaeota archaeon]